MNLQYSYATAQDNPIKVLTVEQVLFRSPRIMSSILLKSQVSVTVTKGVSVVGMAGWPVILTGWPAGRCATLSGRGARVYTCT